MKENLRTVILVMMLVFLLTRFGQIKIVIQPLPDIDNLQTSNPWNDVSKTNTCELSIEEQMRLLKKNRYLWYTEDSRYVFTDLDHNGLTEVICASIQGSGLFTYADAYEVMPDGSGIRNLTVTYGECVGIREWPDIIQDSLPCYYDSNADCYYYVCEDFFKSGVTYNMTHIEALSLKNGIIKLENLASKEWYASGTVVKIAYQDEVGNQISEKDYNSVVQRRFAGMEWSELKLEWINNA